MSALTKTSIETPFLSRLPGYYIAISCHRQYFVAFIRAQLAFAREHYDEFNQLSTLIDVYPFDDRTRDRDRDLSNFASQGECPEHWPMPTQILHTRFERGSLSYQETIFCIDSIRNISKSGGELPALRAAIIWVSLIFRDFYESQVQSQWRAPTFRDVTPILPSTKPLQNQAVPMEVGSIFFNSH